MRPPVIIVGRARSGTRAVAGLLQAGGLWLGLDLTRPQLDSWGWHQRYVVPSLIGNRPVEAEASRQYWGGEPWACVGAWGFKCAEAGLMLPEFRKLFPGVRFVHVRRDPRDVCLSKGGWFQLGGPLNDPPGWGPGTYAPFCEAVTFGSTTECWWDGLDLADPTVRGAHRFELQAQSWLTAVTELDDQSVAGDVIDICFEDLCADPAGIAVTLARDLRLPDPDRAAAHAAANIDPRRVGAWRRARLSARDRPGLERACSLVSEWVHAA